MTRSVLMLRLMAMQLAMCTIEGKMEEAENNQKINSTEKNDEKEKIATFYREQRLARKQANFLKRQPKRKPNP